MAFFKISEYDKKIYDEELKNFLPEKIIDVHTHIWLPSHKKPEAPDIISWPDRVASDNSVENLLDTYTQMFPDKKVIPVIFGTPTANIRMNNEYTAESANEYHLPHLMLTDYAMSGEYIEQEVTRCGYQGIKPYLSNGPIGLSQNEMCIFDFLPREHLRVMNKLKLVVMLHIPRSLRLRDPLNIKNLLEIEEKYPDIKLIIAHIGRAYAPEDIGNAFEILSKTQNMVFDTSANTLDRAMIACVEAVGSKRVLFGSDLPITKMRMSRIVENGIYYNIVPKGLYGDISKDAHMRESDPAGEDFITIFMYEELMALKRSTDQLQLCKEDIENIFYNNAASIFRMENIL